MINVNPLKIMLHAHFPTLALFQPHHNRVKLVQDPFFQILTSFCS